MIMNPLTKWAPNQIKDSSIRAKCKNDISNIAINCKWRFMVEIDVFIAFLWSLDTVYYVSGNCVKKKKVICLHYSALGWGFFIKIRSFIVAFHCKISTDNISIESLSQ